MKFYLQKRDIYTLELMYRLIGELQRKLGTHIWFTKKIDIHASTRVQLSEI